MIARSLAFALRFAALAPLTVVAAPLPVLAQTQQDEAPPQIALTDAQVQAYLSAEGEMAALTTKQEGASDKPDPKVEAQLDAIAKKYKFASLDEYDVVDANIGLVVDGIDPQTRKYVGADIVLKKQIAEVQGDKSMAPSDKKAALAEMNGALKAVQPLKYPANIDIVLKYYDKLAAASGQTD
ncbi:MAG TPA: hypothetical protein VGH40_18890 [Roseiarcus sp.]|jgi:hypothetical protein